MHNFEVATNTAGGCTIKPVTDIPHAQSYTVKFSHNQTAPLETRINKLITQKINERTFFYGIELTPTHIGPNSETVFDFEIFADFLPLFTSIVWLTQLNWQLEPIECIDAIELCGKLVERIPCASHFSAYRVSEKRLNDFLALKQTNVLAIRGDLVDPEQQYLYASEMIAEMRRIRGDKISIGVGGYPNLHPEMKTREQDIQNLVKKVNAGADYIITQICYSSLDIIEFVKSCRAAGIEVPILVGIIIPHSLGILKRIDTIAHVRTSDDELAAVEVLDQQQFLEYFIEKFVSIISEVLAANIGIYGFHFFSMNRLENVHSVLKRLRVNGVI